MDTTQTGKKTLIFISISALFIILVLLFYEAIQVMLLAFAGILAAILLRGLGYLIRKVINISENWSHLIAVAVLIILITGTILLLGPAISGSINNLEKEIPEAVSGLKERLEEYSWGRELIKSAEQTIDNVSQNPDIRSRIAGVFSSLLAVLTSVLVIIVIGLYAGFNSKLYTNGFLLLIPRKKRKRAEEVLNALEHALLWWMAGRFASMTVVGILTIIGLLVLDVRLAFTLGLVAALLSFVPNIGPVISAIPAIAMGFLDSPQKALYVIFLYIGIQLVESYVITPQIQKRAVSISPALLLIVQFMIGVLLGIPGLILATPLMVVVIVLIQMLYVQDMLGENVKVLGE